MLPRRSGTRALTRRGHKRRPAASRRRRGRSRRPPARHSTGLLEVQTGAYAGLPVAGRSGCRARSENGMDTSQHRSAAGTGRARHQGWRSASRRWRPARPSRGPARSRRGQQVETGLSSPDNRSLAADDHLAAQREPRWCCARPPCGWAANSRGRSRIAPEWRKIALGRPGRGEAGLGVGVGGRSGPPVPSEPRPAGAVSCSTRRRRPRCAPRPARRGHRPPPRAETSRARCRSPSRRRLVMYCW